MLPPDVELTITPPARLYEQTRHVLTFLRTAAQKHQVTISFSANKAGTFKVSIPGKDCWNLDSFLQEITFQRGLYYYLCGVSNRREVARLIVKPIFQEMLEVRFSVAYPVQIQKHLLAGTADWAGGEFLEGTSQEYEILFQKLKLKMISGYEFVRDTDDLLMEFMLKQLGHAPGDQSPKFNILVDRCGKQNVLRTKEVRKLFNRIHSLRTRGLHRLEREIPDTDIADIAQSLYNVFEWLDDYWRAQDEKTVKFSGKRYRRIRYGSEPIPRDAPDDFRERWEQIIQSPCHDCGVVQGELHLDGCDMEICPCCSGQYMCCDCRIGEDDVEMT